MCSGHSPGLLILLVSPLVLITTLDLRDAFAQRAKGAPAMSFTLETTAFEPGGTIPKKYTCDGPDVSPALRWSDPPAGTEGFVLIADDPDAPVGI